MTEVNNSSLGKRDGERSHNGFPLLPLSDPEAVVTLETVSALREELAVTTDAPSDWASNLR